MSLPLANAVYTRDMGKEIKPIGGGLWGWLKGAFLAVAKSGAATETWKFVAPWVLPLIGAVITAFVATVSQAPMLWSVVGASIVFAASAFGAFKVQAFLENRRNNARPEPPSAPLLSPAMPIASLQMEVTRAADKPQIRAERLVEDFNWSTGKKTIRLEIYNPTDQRVEGLVARLVDAKGPFEPPIGLPIVLTTKARLDRHRFSGESIPAGPFSLGGYEKSQIELFQANLHGAFDGTIFAEAGEITFLLLGEELWVEVIGGGMPVRVGISIEKSEDGKWTTSLIIEATGETQKR